MKVAFPLAGLLLGAGLFGLTNAAPTNAEPRKAGTAKVATDRSPGSNTEPTWTLGGEITTNQLIELGWMAGPTQATPTNLRSPRDASFWQEAVESASEPTLGFLAGLLNLPRTNLSNVEELRRDLLAAFLPAPSAAPSPARWTRSPLLDSLPSGALTLEGADRVVSLSDPSNRQKLIRFIGDVRLRTGPNRILAPNLLFDLGRKEISADAGLAVVGPGLSLVGDRGSFQLDGESGEILDVQGTLNEFSFSGEVLKLNGLSRMTIRGASLFIGPQASRPPFRVRAEVFDRYGEKRYLLQSLGFYVHNHPFFWFPIFLQDGFGTGVDLKTGRSSREGLFALSKIAVPLPFVGPVAFQVNLFEKLGAYGLVQTAGDTPVAHWEGQFGLGWSTEIRSRESLGAASLESTAFSGYALGRKERLRFRASADLGLQLLPDPTLAGKITSRLSANVREASDPYVSSEFERNPPNFDPLAVLRSQVVESRYLPSPVDTRLYRVQYQFGMSGLSILFGAGWNFLTRENFSVVDPSDPARWETRLSSILLPEISAQWSGVLDATGTNRGRPHLDVNYQISASLRLLDYYNPTNFLYDYRDNRLNFDFGLSRTFRFDEDGKGRKWEVLDFSLSPSARIGYQKVWGGEEKGASRILENQQATSLFLEGKSGFQLNLPSAATKAKWSASPGWESMLPTFGLQGQWSFRKDDVQSNGTLPGLFAKTAAHQVNASASLVQAGYGLFFLPWLDYTLSLDSSALLDLLPSASSNGVENLSWTSERLQNWTGNLRLNLHWKDVVQATYALPTRFWNRTNVVFEPQNHQIQASLRIPVPGKPNPWFGLLGFQLDSGYSYYLNAAESRQDSLFFRLGFSLRVLKFFDLSFSADSLQRNAYLYDASKAREAGKSQLGFFPDLLDSIGVNGQTGLERGNIKLNRLEASITHDLDAWFLRLAYSIAPVPLANTGSVRGYFFDQNLSFEINLKPEFKPKQADFTIPPWKQRLLPPALKNLASNQ